MYGQQRHTFIKKSDFTKSEKLVTKDFEHTFLDYKEEIWIEIEIEIKIEIEINISYLAVCVFNCGYIGIPKSSFDESEDQTGLADASSSKYDHSVVVALFRHFELLTS